MKPSERKPLKASAFLILLAACLSVVACGTADDTGQTIRIDIPPNATELVEQGRDVPGVPDRIEGSVGDTLVIENRDGSTQFVAGYSISPGQTLRIPLSREGDYQTNCSAHEDSSLQMSISE
jgi:hypothetical protein